MIVLNVSNTVRLLTYLNIVELIPLYYYISIAPLETHSIASFNFLKEWKLIYLNHQRDL